ncbi:hypothetical protein SLS53_005706 [Cytospora paraplurivora]|uniref:Calcineurin-like phosphoesterase domain-containing protein n=1 Tax=Cytospora paraplurivora TaxID=2898453 RepID=A0AAN9YE83_9PEZI
MSALVCGFLIVAWWQNGVGAWPALSFTDEGTFQIAIFEDLHFGEAENTNWGPLQDVDTLKVIRTVLGNESPQLVVLNGDLITGENTLRENSTNYVDEIVAPLVEAGLPWASTYGNHDSDFNLSRAAIYAREKTYDNSLTQWMVNASDTGVTNYYLPVYPTSNSTEPALILWFFDSRGGNYYQARDNLTNIHGTSLPSLAFVHIPVDAFLAFQEEGVDANTEPGINADDPLAQQGDTSGQGDTETVFTYDDQDVPFMQALLDTENLMAVFSGHDHGNDWCFKWSSKLTGMTLTGNALDLCFSRHTGYGGYGSWSRGSRQVLVNLNTLGNSTETWNRLEDGSITGAVSLNSTFGTDEYPVVNYTYTSE